MDTSKQTSTQEEVLSARKIQLEELSVGSLRPHGKLWGMDVFSWFKPSLSELENTLCSFPFPVIWLTRSEDVNALLTVSEDEWTFSLDTIAVYDQANFTVTHERMWDIDRVLTSENLTKMLQILPSIQKKNGIVLFTATGENWKEYKTEFESFLAIHQD